MVFASIAPEKFLWLGEPSWFQYVFGITCTALTVLQLVRQDLQWADWVFFLGFLTPMTTCFLCAVILGSDVLYLKGNWYFGFFTFIIACIYYVA